MKSKKIIYVIVPLLLIVLIGYVSYIKFTNNKSVDNSISNKTDSSIITSIKDALSKKMTLVCEFKDATGAQTRSYIKNGAIRVSLTDNSAENKAGEIIIKDQKMYMWDLKTKTGFVYDVPDNNSEVSGNEVSQSESYLQMIDQYKDSCKVSAVEDSYFVPPVDVNFQDMSKLLEDMKKQIPQFDTPTE